MSYILNKTDGTLLVTLVDGSIDTTSTDITLVGRNYKGFGEYINENYIKMLENFSSSTAPTTPLKGQLWYDTASARLKIFNGTDWKVAGGPIVSNQQPQNLVAGDLWIDDAKNRLYFYDGTDLVLVGPSYTAGQGKTGFESGSVIDEGNVERVILKLFVGGVLSGIHSRVQFRPGNNFEIQGYPLDPDDTNVPQRQIIKVGFNPVDPSGSSYKYNGTAESADALIDGSGVKYDFTKFVATTGNQNMTGSLFVKNSGGLAIGVGDSKFHVVKIDGTTSVFENQQGGSNIDFRVRVGNTTKSALFVDSANERVGFFNNTPTKSLDVVGDGKISGNLEVGGNLTVTGTSFAIDTSNLSVESKNVELAIQSDSTVGNDTAADGGGIILNSSAGSKDILWSNSTGHWTFNQDIDIIETDTNLAPAYYIKGVKKLSETELHATVTKATGLTQIGTLSALDVDNININGTTITSSAGLSITTSGDIAINTQKITGLGTPTGATHATTKGYVDEQRQIEPIIMSLDITGLTDPNTPGTGNGPVTDVIDILTAMYTAGSKTLTNGAKAVVHAVDYSSATVTGINIQSAMSKSAVTVDKNNVVNAQSVVQDINFSAASGAATLTPSRYTMVFTVSSGAWTHTNTTAYTP
jgi:hypothetical protein